MSGLLPVQLRRAARPVTHDRVRLGRHGALARRAYAERECISCISVAEPPRTCTATYLSQVSAAFLISCPGT